MEGVMKRSLLLIAVTLLVLSVPTVASACTETCDLWAPCYYYEFAYSYCHESGNFCWFSPCLTSTAANPELLSSKWQIASVEIERRGPVDTRESETRIASHTEPVKAQIPSLE
jgi:hypothetical protein